ncbi:hypothetical protein AVENLUH5627_00114 [Acinetobacter venetianus]|uniref:Uncharacterized protein n=1 Tax=Acinetobacter venetianus TaxID=52133 RepID=A0A150I3J9_9GAMM|nr:hypothetical protein [Acinetobacter venetianus]KXZ74179.1 hypothetical protein AVENLUH5627_00114 [Acinetobacter venetianus]
MHESRPYGLFSRGAELTADDVAFIDQYCKKVSNFKQLSNLESVKYTRELPNGGFVVIQDAGGNFRAVAYKPKQIEESRVGTGQVQFTMPMLFSGVIDQGIAYRGRGIEIKLTTICTRRLGGYDQGQPVAAIQELQRFRCPYSEENKAILVPQFAQGLNPDNALYTQYHALKPTWFSGAMAEAAQIVGGFGRQKMEDLPEDPVERAVFTMPPVYLERIKAEIGENVLLPGYSGVPDDEGKIPYSFTFHKTDLISFDDEDNPWLVRVQMSGVWAMPLPIIPITTTQAFSEYIAEVNDTEIEMILERFGGIPSGEGFPDNDMDFIRWMKAGVIIKVCDTSDFYDHSAYSTVCGWSSNLRGTNLINTCYDYVNKYCFGYTYQINLRLSAAQDRGWMKGRSFNDDPPSNPQQVAKYLSGLFDEIGGEGHLAASIRYKIRRVAMTEIESRSSRSGASDVEYWDNYQCEPIASHEGRTSCTNSGYLYGGVRFKLPEPFFTCCINMDFSPRGETEGIYPKVDTIIYAYYIGDELKVVKNFRDERKYHKNVEGSFEDEMIVGSWEQTEYSGYTGLSGEYYSTDFDSRTEIAPTEKYTKIVGRDLGYGKPMARYAFYFWTAGTLFRQRHYTHDRREHTKFNKEIREAFIVPYFQRNAVIYAETERSDREYVKESLKMYSVTDPNSYEIWTYDLEIRNFNNAPKRTGTPFPVDSYPVWAETYNYSNYGSAAEDFADEGDWIGASMPADVTDYANPPGGRTLIQYGGDKPNVEEYEENYEIHPDPKYVLKLSMMETPLEVHTRKHNDQYYKYSPDRWGLTVYEDASKVVFGNASYANISIKTEAETRYRFGYSRLADNKTAHTFIGVINE